MLLLVFICCVFRLADYRSEYREQERLEKEAVEKYIREVSVPEMAAEILENMPEQGISAKVSEKMLPQDTASGDSKKNAVGNNVGEESAVCPIAVDFGALLEANEDIVGWLYCEGTNINYPVVQGKDNDYYLHHAYDKSESRAGALFVDAENRPQFADSNTIIYGHHMKNGSMFAHLAYFAGQEYFDAHPVMWLLTPEGNYRVELLGGYLTSAESDSYTIFTGACREFDEYLAEVLAALDVQPDADVAGDGRYIMLSTCEYDFEDARYVLHGRLLPAE